MSAVTYTHTRPSYQNGGEIKVATQLILQIPLWIDKLVYFDQMFYYYKTKYFIKNYCTNRLLWWILIFVVVARGWEQLEVTCNPFVDITNNVLWNIEGNAHAKREWQCPCYPCIVAWQIALSIVRHSYCYNMCFCLIH